LKLAIVDGAGRAIASTKVEAPFDIAFALSEFAPEDVHIDAAGVRVVHGGEQFSTSVVVTEQNLDQLRALADLAPLHNPPAIAALESMLQRDTSLPVVACFDTAFHSTMPAEATTYAIPEHWRETWNLRRFGFHGLSHAYASRRAAELLEREGDASLRLVTCHLGAGASLAAVVGGASVDTTMGFTPIDGLVMATRSGSVDPGLLLWLCAHAGIALSEVESALEHESGLFALAATSDMHEVLARADGGDQRCVLARDVYIHRLCGFIAAMVASMSGVDGIVFTGGVGEGSAEIRWLACSRLEHLGVKLDAAANRGWPSEDGLISAAESKIAVAVVAAREDLEIAREVRAALA